MNNPSVKVGGYCSAANFVYLRTQEAAVTVLPPLVAPEQAKGYSFDCILGLYSPVNEGLDDLDQMWNNQANDSPLVHSFNLVYREAFPSVEVLLS
jgi:hypothetical protein